MPGMTKKSTKAAPKAAPKATPKAAPAPVAAAAPAERNKLAKTQLTDLIAEKSGLTRKQSSEMLDATLDIILDALKSGKAVGLPGLGTLSVKETAARTGVRPGTTEKIEIPAGKKVAFKVAVALKEAL
ncbi:HU family DNA-binding protein [Deinococcus sp. Leaf326]|uniref:HU family DNA-binding protein n=1 Tax=Deinococcus sp. Leaf326 TaxID=1736338 RepID=UPI0006F85CEE|nr:HU family DNA-binding protein [Deinococcus sp. Leaf326]KQR25533.1 DNA-binding protein [Deinococcus sp. Leaf326]